MFAQNIFFFWFNFSFSHFLKCGPFLRSLLNLLQYCFCFVLVFWPQGRWRSQLLNQESKVHPLHWKAKSQPLDHQGSPNFSFSITLYIPWKKHIADLLKKHIIHSQDLCLLMNIMNVITDSFGLHHLRFLLVTLSCFFFPCLCFFLFFPYVYQIDRIFLSPLHQPFLLSSFRSYIFKMCTLNSYFEFD